MVMGVCRPIVGDAHHAEDVFQAVLVVPSFALALAREVMRSMLLHNLKVIALTLLLLGVIATGAGLLNQSFAMKGEPKGPPALQPPLPEKSDGPIQRPAPGRMIIAGRVLDPQGKSIPNATVMAYAQLKQFERPSRASSWNSTVSGRAHCDESGRFQIDAQRTSSARHDLAGVTAIAPGYGVGWFELDPDAGQPTIEITLQPEQVIHGRLFNLQGRPAQGVSVRVWSVLIRPLDPLQTFALRFPTILRFEMSRAAELSAWPKPATSDADGRFTLHGLGRGLWVGLIVDDARFASQPIVVGTDGTAEAPRLGAQITVVKLKGNSDSTSLSIALQPRRTITGRVTYADTGKPAADAVVETNSRAYAPEVRTDAQGRFRVNPSTGNHFVVTANPADGQP